MPSRAAPLVLIGASVRAAAVDAAAAGYRIIAIDRFGDRDLQAVCHAWHHLDPRQDWLRLIDAWPDAAVVPTGGFSWGPRPCPPSGRLIAYPRPDVLQMLVDPEQLRSVAQRCGIDFPTTLALTMLGPGALRTGLAERWLVKPRLGGGGIGIRRWPPATASAGAASNPQEVLQQWVAGRPLGVSYLARLRAGRRVTRLLGACDGLTYRKHRDWPWLYGGSLGPLRLAAACQQTLARIGEQVAARFALVGLFNVDLIRRRDGSLVLLEINPRYSASMELLTPAASGPVSLIHWHLTAYREAARQIETQAADERTGWGGAGDDALVQGPLVQDAAAAWASKRVARLACKRIVYAAEPMQVEQSAAELARRVTAAAVCDEGVQVSFHDLPPSGERVAAGHPALSVIVRGGSDAAALARCSHRVAAYLRRHLRLR